MLCCAFVFHLFFSTSLYLCLTLRLLGLSIFSFSGGGGDKVCVQAKPRTKASIQSDTNTAEQDNPATVCSCACGRRSKQVSETKSISASVSSCCRHRLASTFCCSSWVFAHICGEPRSVSVSLHSFVVFVCVRACALLVSLSSFFVRVRSADIVRRCVSFSLSRLLVPFPLCLLSFCGFIPVATFHFSCFLFL